MEMINHLLPMRELECEYKELYELHPEIADHGLNLDDFKTIIEKSDDKYQNLYLDDLSAFLEEDKFFQRSQDVSAFHHYRFMPAIYHEHDFFEVACVLSGSFHNFIGEQDVLLTEGDILILAPHTKHAVCSFHEDSILINILIRKSTFHEHFMEVLPDNDLLHSFFAKTLYQPSSTPYLLFKTGTDDALTNCILEMNNEFRRNKQYKNTMLAALTSIFFVTLLRKHEKDVIIPGLNPSIMNENTIFILEYMQKNYATITLSHLADFFNYSERQIQRIITTATGYSFSDNIKRIRMKHAARLLKDTDMTIVDIAASLGYYDASSFRHIFKHYYKITPQQYRFL